MHMILLKARVVKAGVDGETADEDGRRLKDIEAAKRAIAVFHRRRLQYRAPPLRPRLLPAT